MAVGDRVTGVLYAEREDGVKLYRYAVPNGKDAETGEWLPPKKKILQEQTGKLYDDATDVEDKGYTYIETDIPIDREEEEEEDEQAQKAAAYDIIVGGEQNEPN